MRAHALGGSVFLDERVELRRAAAERARGRPVTLGVRARCSVMPVGTVGLIDAPRSEAAPAAS